MQKICFFMENPFTLGGEQRVTLLLANYLVQKECKVYLLLNCTKRELLKYQPINKKIEIILLKNKSKIRYKAKALFIKLLKKINYKTAVFHNSLDIQKWFYSLNKKEIIACIKANDFKYVIGVGSYFFGILANIKNQISSTKIVAWQHSTFENYFKSQNNRFYNQERFVREIFSKIDIYVCQTNSDKEKILKEYNYTPIVINNPNTFDNYELTKNDKKRFIASGRFVKLKGFDKLVDAFFIFSDKNKDWDLCILGNGPEYDNIKNKVKQYGLESRVLLPGRVDDVKTYYLNSTVCVITSAWEGWCMVATEAMQCGLPIISFDLPSLREIFGNANCGYLVKNGDVKALAEKMLEVTKIKNLEEISNTCINQVQHFDIEKIGKKWENILK